MKWGLFRCAFLASFVAATIWAFVYPRETPAQARIDRLEETISSVNSDITFRQAGIDEDREQLHQAEIELDEIKKENP
jgi:hypothetical protein